MNFSKYCTPALIYLIISVITLVMGAFTNFNLISFVISGFFILLWSWFLNFLCGKGLTVISWILVVLPILASVFLLFNVMKAMN
jgi:hypothetical protein